MPAATHHVPPGLSPLIPQLVATDAQGLIDFLTKAFGAELRDLIPGPDGTGVMHAYLSVEGQVVFLGQPFGPAEPTRANLFLYVPDVDAVAERAVAAGATVVAPIGDMPWGDRWGMVRDPFGNHWQLATHVEDLSPDEIKRRMSAPPG